MGSARCWRAVRGGPPRSRMPNNTHPLTIPRVSCRGHVGCGGEPPTAARGPRALPGNFGLNASLLDAHYRESLGTVRAEHEDSFDVAGPARAGDEGDKARIIVGVFALQQLERGGQIGHKLLAPRQDYVVRRQ